MFKYLYREKVVKSHCHELSLMGVMHQGHEGNLGASALEAHYRQRRVLVMGADGFLGINCIYALQRLGAEISIVSRRATPRAVDFQGRVFHGDGRDRALVRAAVAQQSIVFDFLGTMGAVDSNHDPLRSLEEDCRPHLTLFQTCAEAPTPPLVLFCSSRLVYGKPQYLPVDEAHPCQPQSMYAVHKLTSEQHLQVLQQSHGLRFCVLRKCFKIPIFRRQLPGCEPQQRRARQPQRQSGCALAEHMGVPEHYVYGRGARASGPCPGETPAPVITGQRAQSRDVW
ncbi:MAG: NAD-dependent epimerase/dehydratase family protein [Candidatus Tectomicrobia bacterium]|uniref:UDP-glucose 4-epimerase n=1 Tax=Tectimicrobiota bacterium TaxID=2528274 RepID=A0A937VZG7_UNCTE|nr:NAD-dependent epimerase/dehydratase family protein [Candidatus Tectomicrobia bacterium]